MSLQVERLERAKELLANAAHAALATVNDDGSPHNSPVFAAFGQDLQMYWSSHPASRHSRNIDRSGQVFIVLFGQDEGGGLYIEAAAEPVSESDIDEALQIFDATKVRNGDVPLNRAHVTAGHQRLYRARPKAIFVNQSEKDENGAVLEDKRYQITVKDLQ
jgi:uncharacterized pyridoxamine 5'-phosphate oxidase family protein